MHLSLRRDIDDQFIEFGIRFRQGSELGIQLSILVTHNVLDDGCHCEDEGECEEGVLASVYAKPYS